MTESRVIITADANRAVSEFQRFRTQAVGALDQVSKAGGIIGGVLGAVGASLSIAAFTGWIKGAIDATDAASDLSQRTGVAIEDLAGLELALQMGGMEASALEGVMSKLSKQIVDGSDAFQKLGLKSKSLDGSFKSNKDMLYELADKFADMEDGVQKVAIAQELFGKSGAAMIPVLNGGAAGLREMDEMARKLGLSLSQDAVDKAGEFNDTLDLLMLGGQGVVRGIAAELLPTLSNLGGQFLATMTSGDRLKNTAAFLASGLKILYTVGVGIVEVFSTVGKTIGAAGAQMVALLQGNFSQAAEIGRLWKEDVGGSWKATLASIEATWADTSDGTVESMVKLTKHSTTVGKSAAELAEESKKAAKAHEEEAKALAELAGLSGTFSKEWEQLTGLYNRKKISVEQLTKAQAELLAGQPGIKAAADAELAERKALTAAAEQYADAYDKAAAARVKALDDLDALREENSLIGLGALELAELNAVRLESRALRADENAEIAEGLDLTGQLAQQYRDVAAALRELANEKRSGARRKIAADEAKAAQEDWKRAGQDIEKSLTDALLRGFESGQSIGRNLINTLKNMFGTLVLRPVISAAVSPLAAGLTGSLGLAGAANAATGVTSGSGPVGALAGLAGSASNLYGMVTGGATLAGGLGTGFLGSLAGGLNGAGIGSGLTSALGMNIGNSIASVVGPNVASGIATGLSGLAAAAPWVAGALAVYTIGKAAFGRGPKEFTGEQTLNGSLGAGGFMGTLDAEWVKKGGWFRSDKNGVDRNTVGAEMSAGLTSAYNAIKASSADFARVLGINADSIATRTQAISIAMGKDEAANQKAIADFFVGVGNTIAGELLPEIGKFQAQGEAASATLQRLAAGYSTIEQALWSIGMSFGAVGTASLEARERLLAAAGGIEAFAANTAGFQQNFLSEAERNAPVLKMVAEQMAALGLASVDTRDEFKQVVLGLDLTTEAGAKQYGALMNLQAAFAQVYPATEAATKALQERASLQEELDQLTMTSAQLLARQRDALDESNRPLFDQIQALKESRAALEAQAEAQRNATQAAKDRGANLLSGVDSMFSALQSVVSREKSLLEQSANAHRALSQALRSTLDSMSVAGRELEDRQSARAQVQAALAIAKAGGVLPDADSLKGALSVLSKDASSMFATQQDYLRDFYSTQNDIAALAGLTDDALSVEEKSLKALDGILESARQQINALKGLDYSVLTLAQAISGFDRSLGAAKADPVASAGGSIANLYRELLGRPADSAGLDYWQNAVAGGMPLDQVRKMIMESAEYKGIPGFASGGMFGGGLRIVGENGPELEATGPSRIWNASQTSDLLSRLSSPSDNSAALVAELRAVRQELAELRRDNSNENYSVAKHLVTISDRVEALEKWDMTGMPGEREA